MNNVDLDKKLKSIPIPSQSNEYWESFPRRVIGRLESGPRATSPQRASWPQFGLAAAVALAAFAVLWPPFNRPAPPPPRNVEVIHGLADGKLWREMAALFPNQIRAVVKDDRGLRLILSEQPDIPTSPVVWIKMCAGNSCQTTLTVSGQEMEVGGEKIGVLTDAQGHVILTGDHFVWTSEHPAPRAETWRIEARSLL
jgi:hypothetical protein